MTNVSISLLLLFIEAYSSAIVLFVNTKLEYTRDGWELLRTTTL